MKVISSTKQFVLRYNPKTVIPPVAARYLAVQTHPIRPKIAHMYATRDPNTLWWRVSVSQLLPFKRVVRSWSARRVRMAFRKALAERGYDDEGKRIVNTGQELRGDMGANTGGLKGSAEIIVRPDSIKVDFGTVQEEVNVLVDALLKQRDRPRGDAQQGDRQQWQKYTPGKKPRSSSYKQQGQ